MKEYVLVVKTSAQVGPDDWDILTFVKDVTGMTIIDAMKWAESKCGGTPIEAKIIEVDQN